MDTCQRLGQNVRRLREDKALSQDSFADEAGIYTYVSNIERGVRNPTVGVVERLAFALGVTASELVR